MNIPGSRNVLLADLLNRASRDEDPEKLPLEPMKDGGMGSHVFLSDKEDRMMGAVISECQFKDTDGVPVLAALYTDEDGDLFELDLWKLDFSPLLRWPEQRDLFDVDTTPNE